MKKVIALFLMILSATFLVSCFGGDDNSNAGNNPPEQPQHVCEWQTTLSFDSEGHFYKCKDPTCKKQSQSVGHEVEFTIDDSTLSLSASAKCKECEYAFELDKMTLTPNDYKQKIERIFDPTFIELKRGSYSEIKLYGKKNLIIYAGANVTVEEINIEGTCSNILIMNVNFDHTINLTALDGGVNFWGKGVKTEAHNVELRNCHFTNNTGVFGDAESLVDGFTVKECTFFNLKKCSVNGYRSAIAVKKVIDLVVDHCTFETVAYNALQVGSVQNGGKMIITNNLFYGIASRVLNLYAENVTEIDISSNLFMKEICTNNEVVGVRKQSGVYICFGDKQCAVGANLWEEIPENNSHNFYNTIINMNEQKQIIGR